MHLSRHCTALVALSGLLVSAATAADDAVYFVVGEQSPILHGDSYVIALTEPIHIAHARDLIKNGPSAEQPIVTAHIAEGSDGINRDVLACGEPLWSWHVVEVLNFTDFSAEIYDGWPTYVQENLDSWINESPGPFIAFWSYTVIAELETNPFPCGGDLNRDGTVGPDDLAVLLGSWGVRDDEHEADLDCDGSIGAADLAALLGAWGPCP